MRLIGDDCCTRCGKLIDPDRQVWLELDQRIDAYHDFGGIPDHCNQGGFAFGADCAKRERTKARAKQVMA